MKFAHFTLLSVGTLIVLSGCYERGKAIPPSMKKKITKQKEEKLYDFPVLKLSAKADTNKTAEEILNQAPKITQNKTQIKKSHKNSRFPKMETSVESTKVNPKKIPLAPIKKQPKRSNSADKIAQIQKALQKENQFTPQKQKSTIKKDSIKQNTLKEEPIKHVSSKKKKNILHKKRAKSSGSSQIPILGSITSVLSSPSVSLQNIPIINKIVPKPSEASKRRIKKRRPKVASSSSHRNSNTTIPVLDSEQSSHTPSVMNFSGGTSTSSLDMAKIRVESDNYQTNIILDSYIWAGYNTIPTEPSAVSGIYFFRYEPSSNRIVGNIKGYNTFSALLTKQDDMIKNNPMIKNIYIDRYIGDDGIKFIIELKKKAKVDIIDVEDPGSIIIELYPQK